MDDLVAELQDFRHLRWDERTTTSGTSGTFPKARAGEGRARRYYKLSCYDSYRGIYGHECVNELLAGRVMEHLGIPHARYRLIHGLVVIDGEERETWLNESPSFRAPDERKMAFDLFYDLNRRPGESPFDLARRYGWGPQVAALIIADYLIANRDRHGANIEVIRSPEGSVRLAPLFDSGLSFVFSCYGDEERVRAFDPLSDVNANNYLGTRSLEENLRFVGELVETPLPMPPLGEGRIRALTDGIGHAVSDAHVAKMREMLARRWEHLLAGASSSRAGRTACRGRGSRVRLRHHRRPRPQCRSLRPSLLRRRTRRMGHPDSGGRRPRRGAVPFLLVRRKGGARDRACVGASLGGRARGASGTAEPGRGLEGEWPPGIQRVRPARYWEGGLFAGLFRAARAVSRR